MNNREMTLEEQVLLGNYRQLCDTNLNLQIKLNRVSQERDHYKTELEKLVDEKSKPKESTKK